MMFYSNSQIFLVNDGWDRKTQLVSLASLPLDPYYRTIKGFQERLKQSVGTWLKISPSCRRHKEEQRLKLKVPFSEDGECVGIENDITGIPQKSTYPASDKESSVYLQHENKSDLSVSGSVLDNDVPINLITHVCESLCPLRTRYGGCRWPDAECAKNLEMSLLS
ncbi:unnamed protein product [Fraxinus pennsylvanica]|uniref:Myotubularin phosphatase domain-containing protein n=1 Tax=Fraxinus pennsylvanica TaxID=56036 RepID=A0AAD1YYX7_9LAMI|nr:unnamed protein product [Fraxinus pennsylvanica]